MRRILIATLFHLIACGSQQTTPIFEKLPDTSLRLGEQTCKTSDDLHSGGVGYRKFLLIDVVVKNNSSTELLKLSRQMFELGLSNGKTQFPTDDEGNCPHMTSITPQSEIRCTLAFAIKSFRPATPTALYFSNSVSPTLSAKVATTPECDLEYICSNDIFIRAKGDQFIVTQQKYNNDVGEALQCEGSTSDGTVLFSECINNAGDRRALIIRIDAKTLVGTQQYSFHHDDLYPIKCRMEY